MDKKNFSIYGALIICMLSWGCAFPAIKIALMHYTPLQAATIRFITASIALIFLASHKKIRFPHLKDLPLLSLLAIIGIFGYHLSLNWGEHLTNAGTAAFITCLSPLLISFISHFFINERMSLGNIVGALFAIVGVWLIIRSGNVAFMMNVGVIVLLISAICWSLFFILQKILLRKYSSIEVTCYSVWMATLLFIVVNKPSALPQLFLKPDIVSLSAAIFLGLFPTFLAYWFWAFVLSHKPVTKVSIYSYSIPFISVLLAVLFLHENYALWFWLGGTFIIIGMYVANFLFRSKLTAPSEPIQTDLEVT